MAVRRLVLASFWQASQNRPLDFSFGAEASAKRNFRYADSISSASHRERALREPGHFAGVGYFPTSSPEKDRQTD
jgi:hypothetical protein